MEFLFMPHQNWSLVKMMLNVNSIMKQAFNVLMTLLNILPKLAAGKTERVLYLKSPDSTPQIS